MRSKLKQTENELANLCSIIKSSKRTFAQLIYSSLVDTAINIFAQTERSIGFSKKRMKRFVKGKSQAQMCSRTANPIAEIEGLFAEYLSIYSLRSLYAMEGAICFKTCAKSKSVSSRILGCPFAGLGFKLLDWQNEVQIFFTASPCSDLKRTVLSIGNFLGNNQWKNSHQLTELNPPLKILILSRLACLVQTFCQSFSFLLRIPSHILFYFLERVSFQDVWSYLLNPHKSDHFLYIYPTNLSFILHT